MKSANRIIFGVFPVLMVVFALCLVTQVSSAQAPAQSETLQPQTVQDDSPKSQTEAKAFTGKIVEQDEKLVLSDADGKTIYQLDDQQKAKEFVDKEVKVTGVLDPETNTIRVSSIE